MIPSTRASGSFSLRSISTASARRDTANLQCGALDVYFQERAVHKIQEEAEWFLLRQEMTFGTRFWTLIRAVRYFNRVSVRYGKAGNAVRVALFVVSATGAFTLLNQWPWWIQLIITIALGAVLAVDFWLNPGKTSIVLHSISVEYKRLEDEWRELWGDVNRPGASEDDIREKSRHLKQKMSMVDARVRDSYSGNRRQTEREMRR